MCQWIDPVQHVGPFVVLMEANSLVSHWNRLHSRVYCRRPRVQVENVNMNQADQVTCLLTRNVNSSLTLMFNKFFRKVSAAQQFTVSDTRCTNIADEWLILIKTNMLVLKCYSTERNNYNTNLLTLVDFYWLFLVIYLLVVCMLYVFYTTVWFVIYIDIYILKNYLIRWVKLKFLFQN